MNSPPVDVQEKWFAGSTGYSIAKYGMSLVVLGLAGELRDRGIAVNALWPRTTVATAAIKNRIGGDRVMRMSRTPDIMADAAYLVFQKPRKVSPEIFSSMTPFSPGKASLISRSIAWTQASPWCPWFSFPTNCCPRPASALPGKCGSEFVALSLLGCRELRASRCSDRT